MNPRKDTLPFPGKAILWFFLNDDDYYQAIGDFEEEYRFKAETKGPVRAKLWFWFLLFKSLPGFISDHLYWRGVMIKNYMKIALRNIKNQKGYSFINITGLAVGIACCLFIILWVFDELSFDRFHKDVDNIYQVLVHTDVRNNSTSPALLAATLKEEFPDIEDATRFHWFFQDALISYKNKSFYERRIRLVDPSFFSMFNFPFLRGDPDSAFEEPYSIVLSKESAEKYFPKQDPMGKILTMNQEHELTVTGVIDNRPRNSTLRFEMLMPMEFRVLTEGSWYTEWTNFFVYSFVKLKDGTNPESTNPKIADVIKNNGGRQDSALALLPFGERYFFFYSEKSNIYVFLTVAAFILIIACFNFMNLSTARSAKRAKEIGMRKVVGAFRKHIIYQFLGESLFFSFTAVILALVMVALLLPLFNKLTGKEILLNQPFILLASIGLALFTGLAAGSYPALFLSSFQPVKVLTGKLKSRAKSSVLRKALVAFQFTLSILLIIGMFVVYKQINYFQSIGTGYNKDHIVSIPMGRGSEKYFYAFKNELQGDARILGVTGTAASLPYFNWHQSGFHWEGKDPDKQISVSYNAVDNDFVETLNIRMVEGRSFAREIASDESASYLVNQEMVKLMGKESVVGEALIHMGNPGMIIGVVENFHFQWYRNQIEPLILQLLPQGVDNLLIRIPPENVTSSLKLIKQTWEKIIPGYPFEYSFLDDDFSRNFRAIERTGGILNSFAVLAVIISCLGLFGLASFAAEERTKEIGIRKVLGSSTSAIVMLLTKDFSKCILLATLIAWPVGYFVMNQWLSNFAYRTKVGFSILIFSSMLALIIAVLTISYQSIKAALANPVDSLRYE
ncbi:MAG: FtsX-like permease family protein [Candidatus Aminicenantes bacterium]|nr:FtsX-like permease family protein [Candidatus Aminicenantes bacterium]